MKKHYVSLLFFLGVVFGYLPQCICSSPIQPLNVSIWSEYKANQFDYLSEKEKTERLQAIFADQCQFVEKHNVRRIIIKVLNPSIYPFFHPKNFEWDNENSVFYWIKKLAPITEVELLFDEKPFHLDPKNFQESSSDFCRYFAEQMQLSSSEFGNFCNLKEKLCWVSILNQVYAKEISGTSLVSGITLDLRKVFPRDPTYQNLVNALDKYKYGKQHVPFYNPFSRLNRAVFLPLDEKDFALINLARFPLSTDLSSSDPLSLGVRLSSTFPTTAPLYSAPSWRNGYNREPLLETVYLQLADHRLIDPIYQNYRILNDPLSNHPDNLKDIAILAENLGKNFCGIPFVKGPGTITTKQASFRLSGSNTFFQTGDRKAHQGQLREGQPIELRPPYVLKKVRRKVAKDPQNNQELLLKAPFSLVSDTKDAEYYCTAVPVTWTTPKTSQFLQSRIYFVFSTEFNIDGERYLGNWSLHNFLSFLNGSHAHRGFLSHPIFTNLDGELSLPAKNIVLYDYSTIPNGSLYPNCDWQLENFPLHDAQLNEEGFITY